MSSVTPTLQDTPPPAGAYVLFDGTTGLAAWTHVRGAAPRWLVRNDGSLAVRPRSGDIVSRERFMDFTLHLEFCCNAAPRWYPEQWRGNSGVYLQGRYEIQVLDSSALTRPAGDRDCGAIYLVSAPRVNASLPPGEWQSYDAVFRAPRFDSAGHKIEEARLTLRHNGVLIHEDLVLPHPTAGALDTEIAQPGPLRLQDHWCAVRYRNIWIHPEIRS